MSLQDIVIVNITTETQSVSRAGFGIPMVLGYNYPAAFTERAREYQNIDAMVTDGFVIDHPAVVAASKFFSQNPKVTKVVLGKGVNLPTMIEKVIPVAKDSTSYKLKINGTEFEFISGVAATIADITLGLTTAINLGSEPVTAGDNGTDMTLTADVAGDLFTLEVIDRSLLKRTNTTTDAGGSAGVVQDIIDIKTEVDGHDDWYMLQLTNQGSAAVLVAAAYIETVRRIMGVTSGDDGIYDTGSTTDLAYLLNASNYARTFIDYHPRPDEYLSAGWTGKVLGAYDPGEATWKFKNLSAAVAVALTSTEITSIEAKKCNHYTVVGGVAIMQQGFTSSGEWIDITRFVDWFQARLEERTYSLLVNVPKVGFTNPGIGLFEKEVRGQISDGVEAGGIVLDSGIVIVPLAEDIPQSEKNLRKLKTIEFSAKLQGAVHDLTINGTLSV